MYNIGVIGLGNRIETLLARLLRALGENGRLAAVMDTRDAETLCSFHPSVAEAIKGAHFMCRRRICWKKNRLTVF